MENCKLCGSVIDRPLSLLFLLSFKKLQKPALCRACLEKLEVINPESSCRGCSKPDESEALCSDCLKWQELYPEMPAGHRSLYSYNETAKKWMKQFKFTGDVYIAESLGQELKKAAGTQTKTRTVVPIPSSETSLSKRGFNQIEVMLNLAKVPYKNYLLHQKNTERQAVKNRRERLLAPQPFSVNELYQKEIQNQKILLVDDVYTTGRTLFHAKECLYNAKSGEVKTLSLFR